MIAAAATFPPRATLASWWGLREGVWLAVGVKGDQISSLSLVMGGWRCAQEIKGHWTGRERGRKVRVIGERKMTL